MKKILEIKEAISEKRNQIVAIVEACKAETRDLTEEEQEKVDELKSQIEADKEEIKALEEELDKIVPKEEETKSCGDEEKEDKRNKNISRNTMKKTSLVKEIRQALADNKKTITINAETRAMTVTGDAGIHDHVIETEIEGILDPLYANSVLSQLGVRWYSGLPMGDVQIPSMTANTVGWEGEIDEASATANAFTSIKLTPHRLTAVVSLSKQLLAQDTIGVENAVRMDIVKALNAKLEASIFDNQASSTERPAGLFYNISPVTVTTFKDVCDLEAGVEENNVYGNMKYVLSPAAKSYFRSLVKGQNNSTFVYDAGEMDGIPSFTTTNVAKYDYVYGDFSGLVVGSWGDLEITLDPYTEASKGCIRLIVNAYFDFKEAKRYNAATNEQVSAFAFGEVAHS